MRQSPTPAIRSLVIVTIFIATCALSTGAEAKTPKTGNPAWPTPTVPTLRSLVNDPGRAPRPDPPLGAPGASAGAPAAHSNACVAAGQAGTAKNWQAYRERLSSWYACAPGCASGEHARHAGACRAGIWRRRKPPSWVSWGRDHLRPAHGQLPRDRRAGHPGLRLPLRTRAAERKIFFSCASWRSSSA